MKTKVDELTIILEELKQKIEPAETERNQYKLDLSHSQEKLAKAAVFIDKLKKERQQLKEQIAELQSSQSTLSDLQEALDTIRQEQLATNEEKQRVFVELEKTKTDLTNSLGDYEKVVSEKAELVSQLADLQKAFDCIERQYKDVQNDRDIYAEKLVISQRNLDDIAQQLASIQEEKNSALANSVELQKSFDDVVERLEAVTCGKQTADKELEDLRTNLAEAAHVAGEGDVNAEKLLDVEEQLRRTKEELAATNADLESEKMRNTELLERVSHSDETGEGSGEPVSQPSGEAGQDENAMRDDLVRELNLQIDQLKAELQLRTTNEQETIATNEKLRNQVKEVKSSIGKSFDESENVETDAVCEDALKGNTEKQPEEETGVWTPISTQTSLSENDAQLQDVLLLREKLVEWETMMQMLQTERDDMEREIVRMGEREKRDGCLLEEILLTLQNALKGRDLFHDQTKTMEDNGVIYAKLSILQSIIDETNFERDEMKEKIQHLTEQVVDLEKRFLETAGSGDTSLTNSRSKGDNEIFSEELNEAGGALQTLPRKEQVLESVSENESIVSSQNKKVQGMSEEVVQCKELLEVERRNSEKWKSSYDEMQRVVEDMTAEKEQLEKALQEALRATGDVQLDNEQHSQNKEKEEDVGDNQTHLCEEAKLDAEASEGKKEEFLMTEQVKQKTVKKSGPLVIQVLLEDEKQRLLEENQNLREEIQFLKKQLETLAGDAAVIISPQAVQSCRDDMSSSETDGIGDKSEMCKAEKDIKDSSLTYAADETGETVGDTGAQFSLDRIKKEITDAECLLQEKRDELQRLSEEINSAEERSGSEAELERLREDCSQAKAEFEVLLQNKNSEIEGLQAELVRTSEELEKNRDHETAVVTLREELVQLRKEKEDFAEQKQMLISELTAAQKGVDSVETVSSEKDAEIQSLKEEHHRYKKVAEERVEEYKSQLQMAVEESGQKSSWDVDQMSLKDAEIQRLEDMLTRLREEMEICIRDKDNEINALNQKVVAAKEELEELDRALVMAREEVQNHLKEILNLRSELSRIQDETADSHSKSDSELEELKAELAKLKALADERESQLDKTAKGIRMELFNTMEEIDEKNQIIKKLEEEVLYVKQGAEHDVEEKNTQIADLEDLVEKLTNDSEGSMVEKVAEIKGLEEQFQQNLEGHIRDKETEIESMRIELLTVKEQLEGHRKDRDDEIERLKTELVKIKEEIEKNTEVSEIERLTAERKVRAELEDSVKVRDVEIEDLKLEIVKIKAEFEDRWKNSNCEVENARTELLAVNQESENLIKTKDQQIGQLQAELLKLKDIEGQLEDTEGQLKDTESQLKEKIAMNERLDSELAKIHEQNENLIKHKESEMKSMKDDIKKSRKDADDLILSKDSEIHKLLAEIDCIREESNRMRASSDTKIENLEKTLEAFQNDTHNTENLNLELQELRAECERMKLIIDKRESEIEQLREELARGKNVMESSFERRENEQLDTSSGQTESSPNQVSIN